MGSIIREETEGEPSAALTETGKGGLFSQGYLRDAPAREYVGEAEAPVFVLADDAGVERERDGDRTTIEPGKGYRSITVVTDRRLIVLVGNAGDGGDRRITLPLVEVTAAGTEDGRLVVEMTSGVTWHCGEAAAGIDEVATYVDAAAETWREVEEALDSVKRSIVEATGRRDEGEYEAALDAMRAARDDIETVQERVADFGEEWAADAMTDRVTQVRDRCLATAAEIRVGYARATIDEGEAHWREGEYERARDAFEEAREAFEAVQSLAPRHRAEVDDVDRALERLERSIERLDDAPLRNAIDADRRAKETESSLEALDALAEARKRYEVVLELDPDADERRFAGDRDRIREQREEVTDRFVETAETVGTEAREAGEWYCETGQVEFAREELERAVEALERGLSVAETERPAVAEELRSERAAAAERLADLDDESPAEDGDIGKTAAASAEPAADAATADGGQATPMRSDRDAGPTVDGDTDGTAVSADDEPLEATLRSLSPAEFGRVVTTVVEAMGWRPEETASNACDYLATREESEGNLAIRSFHDDGEPIGPETVRDCATLAASVPSVEDVLIVTTRPLTDAARATARSQDVRVLDAEALENALGGPDATVAESVPPCASD